MDKGPMHWVGKPIPSRAKAEAVVMSVVQLGLNFDRATGLVIAVSTELEKDNPENAQRVGLAILGKDVTSYFMVVAKLLAGVAEAAEGILLTLPKVYLSVCLNKGGRRIVSVDKVFNTPEKAQAYNEIEQANKDYGPDFFYMTEVHTVE